MLTYHGSKKLKKSRIAQVRAHRLGDQLVKGRYWENGKGCAVGCTIHGNSHFAYECELGIPFELAYLEDFIFEGLPNERAVLWPERFLEAIPVGVDLRQKHINKRLVLNILQKYYKEKERVSEVIALLADGIAQPFPGEPPSELGRISRRAYNPNLVYFSTCSDFAYLSYRFDCGNHSLLFLYLSYFYYIADLDEILLKVLAESI